ncbi:MAG: hypothetical protein V3V59_00070 [Thermodesulfovibrionales bacterium]
MSERKTRLNCWEFKKCGRQPHCIVCMTLGYALLRSKTGIMKGGEHE